MFTLARGWDVVVCIASGSSLTQEQLDLIRAAQLRGAVKVAVVNRTWERYPEADVLFACDTPWWEKYGAQVKAEFRGECWTRSPEAAERWGIHFINSIGKAGLSLSPSIIHEGGNGGYQLVGLVYHFGPPRQIILVAYDMKVGHRKWKRHHEDYPQNIGLSNSQPFASWIQGYAALARDLKVMGVDTVNTNPNSALECFRKCDLKIMLDAL